MLHPALALAVAAGLIIGAHRFPLARGDRRGQVAAMLVVGLAVAQVIVGFVNVLLLAPIWIQLVHLLLADGLWIAFVVLAASALAAARSLVSRRRADRREADLVRHSATGEGQACSP